MINDYPTSSQAANASQAVEEIQSDAGQNNADGDGTDENNTDESNTNSGSSGGSRLTD